MRALRALAQTTEPPVLHVGAVRGPSLARVLSPVTSDEPVEVGSASVDRIRHTVAALRASEERVESRLAELKLETQHLQTRLQAAQAQTESAEAMVSFQAGRADAAEQLCRDTEAKFIRMLGDLADELEGTSYRSPVPTDLEIMNDLKGHTADSDLAAGRIQ
jgi:phage shock protein A